MTGWETFLELQPPWAHLVSCTEDELDCAVRGKVFYGNIEKHPLVRIIRGQYCQTYEANRVYWEAALQYPFNKGWFYEWIEDLEWLRASAYLFVVTNAHQLLSEEDDFFLDQFLHSLDHAARFWAEEDPAEWVAPALRGSWTSPQNNLYYARPAIPFHVLFQVSADKEEELINQFESRRYFQNIIEYTKFIFE